MRIYPCLPLVVTLRGGGRGGSILQINPPHLVAASRLVQIKHQRQRLPGAIRVTLHHQFRQKFKFACKSGHYPCLPASSLRLRLPLEHNYHYIEMSQFKQTAASQAAAPEACPWPCAYFQPVPAPAKQRRQAVPQPAIWFVLPGSPQKLSLAASFVVPFWP